METSSPLRIRAAGGAAQKRATARGSVGQRVVLALTLLFCVGLAVVIIGHMLLGGSAPEGLPASDRPGLLFALPDLFKLGQPSDFLWYALALLTVGSAAGVAFSRNIIYSAFSLLGAFLGVAAMYIYLSAPFLAVTQVLIYIGGVLVLILFAVMLTSHIRDVKISNSSLAVGPGAAGLLATAILLIYVATSTPWPKVKVLPPLVDTSAAIGDAFLSTYLLPFEIASVILLATLIAAVVLARRDTSEPGSGTSAEVK